MNGWNQINFSFKDVYNTAVRQIARQDNVDYEIATLRLAAGID